MRRETSRIAENRTRVSEQLSRFWGYLDSRRLGLAVSLIAVALVQLWLFTDGHMFSRNFLREPDYSGRFVDLANAFAKGNLYLPDVPDPKLLDLADPYDHLKNYECRSFDMSFYKGRYYLYFGAFPALMLMMFRAVGFSAITSDSPFVLFFSWGHLIFFTLALRAACARLFPDRSLMLATLVGLSSGLLGPVTYSLNRPAFYEVAASGGACFVWLGLWLLFTVHEEESISWKRALLHFGGSGLAFGCALGCRMAVLPGVVPIAAWTLWRFRRNSWVIFVPLAISLGATAWYNYARFDDPTNFGYNYQLTIFRNDTPNTFSLLHIPANAYVQFFQVPKLSPEFPFVFPQEVPLPFFVPCVEHFWNPDPTVGLVWCAPVLLLFPLGLWSLKKLPDQRITLTLLLSFLGGLGALEYHHPTVRYQMDYCLTFLTIATFGMYRLENKWPRFIGWLGGILAAYTIAIGLLIGMHAQYDYFKVQNPELFDWMYHHFSFKTAQPANVLTPSPSAAP